jgi:hypothetical protein
MIILLYIFLGILLFDCLLVCCLYFRKERPFSQFWIEAELLKRQKNQLNKVRLLMKWSSKNRHPVKPLMVK